MRNHESTRRLPLFALLAGALALNACGNQEGFAPGAAMAQTPPQAVPVIVSKLTPQNVVLTRDLPGRTNPYLVAEVRPQVSGIVKERLFTEGSTVKAGQALYQLDDATYRANLASAKATLARAQASLESARLTARRMAGLAKIDAVSKQDNENAIAALRFAEADVAAGKAAVQSAEVMVGYARITAPISGRIGKSSVTQGALVTANQATPLATINQLDPIYVDLTQSSSELLELRRALAAGTLITTRDVPVQIILEDGSPYSHHGKMSFADLTVDPATGSFLLRIQVPNPDRLLLPGMYVRALLGFGERANALLVPQQGITRDPKGNTSALVVNADNKVEQRAVVVSRAIGDQWLVESGLAPGDRVIIEGLQKVRPGATVQPTEVPTAAPASDSASTPATASASTPAPATASGSAAASAAGAPRQ